MVGEEAEVILQRLRAAVAQAHQLIRDRGGDHIAADAEAHQAGEQEAQQAGQQHHGQHLGLDTESSKKLQNHGFKEMNVGANSSGLNQEAQSGRLSQAWRLPGLAIVAGRNSKRIDQHQRRSCRHT